MSKGTQSDEKGETRKASLSPGASNRLPRPSKVRKQVPKGSVSGKVREAQVSRVCGLACFVDSFLLLFVFLTKQREII